MWVCGCVVTQGRQGARGPRGFPGPVGIGVKGEQGIPGMPGKPAVIRNEDGAFDPDLVLTLFAMCILRNVSQYVELDMVKQLCIKRDTVVVI